MSSLAEVPRKVIAVLLALKNCPHGATYEGLQSVLGMRTVDGARQAVRTAKELELVRVQHTPDGQGAKAVIYLSRNARTLFRRAGLHQEQQA